MKFGIRAPDIVVLNIYVFRVQWPELGHNCYMGASGITLRIDRETARYFGNENISW